MTTRMLLVRHGESTWNEVRRWQGQADPPLTARGEQQATAAVAAAAGLGPHTAVVTSTLQRARRTGALLAAGLALPLGDPFEALAERAAGEWEGLTRDEINDQYPGYLDEGRRPLGYEADEDVVRRASAALIDIAEHQHGDSLIVVSHGGVINALERSAGEPWVRLDNLEGRWFDVDSAGLSPVGSRVHLIDALEPAVPVDSSYA